MRMPIWMATLFSLVFSLTSSAHALEKVSLTLNFTPYGLHVGPVMAKARGIYAAAGLDVEILSGYGSTEAVKRTALGTTTFAMADATAVIIGRDKGLDTKQVATILDRSSDVVILRKSSGIFQPSDLAGKKFGFAVGESYLNIWPTFAKKAGIDVTKIEWVNMAQTAKIPSLLAGRVDAILGFTVAEPRTTEIARKAGVELTSIRFSDYGVDNYSIGLIVSDALMKSSADLVRKFVNATMAGYALAVAEPDAAADAFKALFPESNRDSVLAEWKVVQTHLVTETGMTKGLGFMTWERMARTIEMLGATTKLEKKIEPSDVFTMEFLEPLYVKR
jgi:NitT/TauT family transport system substrate-binding protein